MMIKNEWPPNIEQIRRHFMLPEPATVYFTFGDTLYNPSGQKVPPDYLHHEEVHGRQQASGAQAWWDRFIADADFRAGQEAEAYGAQVKYLREKRGSAYAQSATNTFAYALSSPLYGNCTSNTNARLLILRASA